MWIQRKEWEGSRNGEIDQLDLTRAETVEAMKEGSRWAEARRSGRLAVEEYGSKRVGVPFPGFPHGSSRAKELTCAVDGASP